MVGHPSALVPVAPCVRVPAMAAGIRLRAALAAQHINSKVNDFCPIDGNDHAVQIARIWRTTWSSVSVGNVVSNPYRRLFVRNPTPKRRGHEASERIAHFLHRALLAPTTSSLLSLTPRSCRDGARARRVSEVAGAPRENPTVSTVFWNYSL